MRRPLFMVCLLLVGLAALRLCWKENTTQSQANVANEEMNGVALQEWEGSRLIVTGQVYQKDTQFFYLRYVSVQDSEYSSDAATQQQIFPYNKNLICQCEDMEKILWGSRVTVEGELCLFAKATNPGEFDAAEYYSSIQIGAKLQKVSVLAADSEYSLLGETLFRIRSYFRDRLYHVFPEKEASVMSTMLLGDKSNLDKEIKALYQRNGIVHILSISGLHITLIGMSIYKLLRRVGLPLWVASICGAVILLLYGIMTGMSISACRAIGMYLIRMFGEIVGRTYDMLTAVGVIAVFMVFGNEGCLQNAGFLLSFGSILGIGVLYPALDKEYGKLRKAILSGFSITLFTLPIQLWFYYEVPVYSVFLNLLILPFMSIVMLFGMLVMLVPGIGVLGTIDSMVLAAYEMLCKSFEYLPCHTWTPGKPKVWQIVIYYLLLSGITILCERQKRLEKSTKNKRKIHIGRYVCLVVAVLILGIHFPKEMSITFLDVGQGDCICMETAVGEVYLFDCGSSSRSKVGEYVLLPYLKYNGIRHVDAVFVSHPDSDHCGGVLELLEYGRDWGITVERLILPGIAEEQCAEEFAELLQVAGENNVTVDVINAGDCWQAGSIKFTCLHPPAAVDTLEANAYSECFWIEMKEAKVGMLLTGDVEGEGEEMLLKELKAKGIGDEELHQTILLKVAHHGSRNSTSKELLEVLSPKLSVISCGKENSYGHPHIETLERLKAAGSKVVSTADYGAITVKIGREVKVTGLKNGYN